MKASLASAAALAAAAVFFFAGGAARADDAGPHPDLRAIRHDVPILEARFLRNNGVAAPLKVDDVVVLGNDAVAAWTAGDARGMLLLHRRSDVWWSMTSASGRDFWRLDAPAALARLAVAHVPNLVATHSGPGDVEEGLRAPYAPLFLDLTSSAGGYDTTLRLPVRPSYAIGMQARAPTLAEMPPTPGANAYYFFSLTAQSPDAKPIAGATLDVWFPFALDANQTYVLWLSPMTPEIAGIPGSLRDNVLHFDLPPFALLPGKTAHGEIDGRPGR